MIAVAFEEVATAAEPPAAELALLSSRATPKRRTEFFAGRAAARRAVAALTGEPASPILRDRAGAPVVRGAYVSISHADGTAVAAASRRRVGVDLVTVEPYAPSFHRQAFARGEVHAWSEWLGCSEDEPVVAAVAFAAKEAALKWLGVGMAMPLPSFAVLPCRASPDAPAPLEDAMPFGATVQPQRLELRGWLARRGAQVVLFVVESKGA